MSAAEIILDYEEQPCLKCGGATDTGWECTDCGVDNRDWYFSDRQKYCNCGTMPDQDEIGGNCKSCGEKVI